MEEVRIINYLKTNLPLLSPGHREVNKNREINVAPVPGTLNSNHRIIQIDVTKTVVAEKPEITTALINEVIALKNTDVGVVSDATVTCKAYLNGLGACHLTC